MFAIYTITYNKFLIIWPKIPAQQVMWHYMTDISNNLFGCFAPGNKAKSP
jgi:hypothetical protein